jgi:hypothetical protein
MQKRTIIFLLMMVLTAVCSLQAQQLYKRSGQLIMVQNRLEASSGDTLEIARQVGEKQMIIGRAIFDRWTGHDTALWIIQEKQGYFIDSGDFILAVAITPPEETGDDDGEQAAFRIEEASRPARNGYFITGVPSRRMLAGLSIGGSAGLFIAVNDTTYNGRGPFFHPELSLILDVSGLRIGINAGRVKRSYTKTVTDSVFDQQTGWKKTREEVHRDIHLFPILLDITLMPLRFSNPFGSAQPYIGLSPGLTLSTGDREEKFTLALALKGGMEFYFGKWWVADMEVRYLIIPDGYGFFTFSTGFRFRVPFR